MNNSIGIFLKSKEEIKIENFTGLSGDGEHLVVSIEDGPDEVFRNEDIGMWVLYQSKSETQ